MKLGRGPRASRLGAEAKGLTHDAFGEMAERPIVQHWKCCVRETVPGVRIPLSPLVEVVPVAG